MDWCPAAADWGTVGEWIGAFVAMLVGAAVVALAVQTNRLAAAANRTNARVAEEQAQARLESARKERRRADLILQTMLIEVNYLTDRLDVLTEIVLERGFDKIYAGSADERRKIVGRIGQLQYGTLRQQMQHASELEDKPASDLLTLVHGLDSLLSVSKQAVGYDNGSHHHTPATMLIVTVPMLRDISMSIWRLSDAAASRLQGMPDGEPGPMGPPPV